MKEKRRRKRRKRRRRKSSLWLKRKKYARTESRCGSLVVVSVIIHREGGQ